MGIIYNGKNITGVKFGTKNITKVIYNNVIVWESSRTYRYNFAGLLVGTSSGIDGDNPSSAGNFRINSTYGAMWCVSTAAADTLGSGVNFAACMQKTITSMKMYVYRANTQTFNTTASNSGWIYNTPPTSAGARALVMSASALNTAGYTHVDTTTPVPTTTGLVQVSLSTDQLKACFTNTATTISAAAGHSPSQIPAGTYSTLGLRGLYSNNPQFTCKSNDATYGYIEIVAS